MTITDANLVLGRFLPDYFPKIFGALENESLDKDLAWSIRGQRGGGEGC